MKNEELIFDFMAAAEETGKRLDALIKVIPGELRKTLSAEYERSPWLATLPTAVERLNTAAKSTESAAARTESTESTAAQMVSKVKTACIVACIAIVVMPLATWGFAYWQMAGAGRHTRRSITA